MTLNEAVAFLQTHDDYIILTHRRPDGDTLGSAAGLCLGLRSMGKQAYVAVNPEAGQRFGQYTAPLAPPADFVGKTIVAVDTASTALFPKEFSQYLENIDLAIDHHPNGGAYAAQVLLYVDCAATGELVTLLLHEMQIPLTTDIALPLYVAIVTDTGCLRYESTSSRTLRLVADLKDTGIRTAEINTALFETKTFSRLALEAALLQDLELQDDGRIALMTLTLAKLAQTKAQSGDTDNISSLARQIAGVEIGILLREEEDGTVKMSMRTAPTYDAGKICAQLGGGGHARAAGCSVTMTVQEARHTILQAVQTTYPKGL